jgi:hypothetical protein
MKKLSQIDQKIEQLRALRQQVVSRDAMTARRQRTQRCVILGAWILANDSTMVEQIVGQLTREQDRKAFAQCGGEGQPPKEQPEEKIG